MASVITDRDRGYKRLIKAARQMLADHSITVGIHSDGDGRNLIIGSAHEFGLGNNPVRSFIAAWVDEQKDDLINEIKKAEQRALKGRDPIKALKQVGARFVGLVQKRMAGGLPPPKADGKPSRLVQTGQLRSSIAFKVDGK
jgi:hypothetical protein